MDGIDAAIESVSGMIDQILYDLRETLPNKFTELKNKLVEKLVELLAPLIEIRDGIINGFLELPQKIIEKVQAFTEEYFLPDEENIQRHIDDIREEFGFIDSMTGYGEHILNFLQSASGTKAPVIQIDLSEKGGEYSWGSETIIIDFKWYTPYKPMVDNIVAGIIWLTWLWHMYKRIPEIIHGQGMTTAHVIDLSDKR